MSPNEEPLRRRVGVSRRVKIQTAISARSAPATRPGKNPTRTAMVGNLLQDAARGIVPFVFVTGITEADCVFVEEAVGDKVEEEEDVGVGGLAA